MFRRFCGFGFKQNNLFKIAGGRTDMLPATDSADFPPFCYCYVFPLEMIYESREY